MPPDIMSTAVSLYTKKSKLEEIVRKIDAKNLSTFFEDATSSNAGQRSNANQDDTLHLIELVEHFAKAFSEAKFPLFEKLKETPVSMIANIPLSYIPQPVCNDVVAWINTCDIKAVVPFALCSLYSILADFPTHSGQQASHKSQGYWVALFTVLGLVLRGKPEVLVEIMPTLSDSAKYGGQDKLTLIVWMIAQACLGDLKVGLYAWIHCLLPIVGGTSTCNPQSIDLILQLVESIVYTSNAENILENGAVREGERLIPPASLDALMRVTFPSASEPLTSTESERFKAVYPMLKKVALAGIPGRQEMEQVSRQIFSLSIKAWKEDNQNLSTEATEISVWCLTKHGDCYNQWETLYDENLKASVAILKKLSAERQQPDANRMSSVPRKTLLIFKKKNEGGLRREQNVSGRATYEDAQKYCTMLLGGRFLSSQTRFKGMRLAVLAVVITVFFGPSNSDTWNLTELLTIVKSWDWTKFWELVNELNHLLEILRSLDSYRPS